ncbi:class F sortase [Dactylosporangium vinaceum]|uniref:Sortase domain-bontaining protein n=1 Tax=Dactylosporangium vinaceum TaxID=53362 RepID=A0ABV5M5I0_9ACTN|nr:class F sortase [Dactylosporangium vinaceum]UAB95544.1 class F sortase [Dactylosporangium vinaceum]
MASPALLARRLQTALWPHRKTLAGLCAGLLAGLIIATLVHGPAPRAGLPVDPSAVGNAMAPPDGSAAAAAPVSAPPGPGGINPTAQLRNGHVQPGEISIPEIGVRSSFVHLGLNRDGTLEAPNRYDVVGWYAAGPLPGDADGPPAVFAGHVDSKAGPGVFFRLHELKVGDEFTIGGTDGAERTFRVYKTITYRKDAFPAKQVYAKSRQAEVRLITCTGTFNSATGHYEGNLVVYAALIGA